MKPEEEFDSRGKGDQEDEMLKDKYDKYCHAALLLDS